MTLSVPCIFLTVWLVGLQNVIVVFSGLLVLRIAHSIAAYPILYLTYREQIRFRLKKDVSYITFKSETALTNSMLKNS